MGWPVAMTALDYDSTMGILSMGWPLGMTALDYESTMGILVYGVALGYDSPRLRQHYGNPCLWGGHWL